MPKAPQSRSKSEPIKLSTYSFAELVEIKSDLDKELESRKSKELEVLRAQVAERAHALGVSIETILGVSDGKRRIRRQTAHPRGPQPPKYRGPNGELWSGKGPAPKWMKPLLAQGQKKADFLIKK